jgi:branched-chain amino acid transport system permease protein
MLGTAVISPQDLAIIIASLALMGVFFAVFRFTPIGKRMRASASNQLGAILIGIRVDRMFGAAWALSCLLGVVAGLLIAPIALIYPDMGFDVFVKAFAGSVLGGFGSFPGAVVGGLLVGVAENLVGGYVSTVLVGSAPFVIITVVLLLFPSGLFGGVRES